MYDVSRDSTLIVADSSAQTGSLFQTMPLLLAILAIFYFLMIRPQQKAEKERQALLASLKKEDRVVTASGIHGRIWAVQDDSVILEISRDVRITVDKQAIRRRLSGSENTSASEKSARSDKPDKSDRKSRKGK